MKPGKLSQTTWRRSVQKQLPDQGALPISAEEMCSVVSSRDGWTVTAEASAIGNLAHTGYYASIKAVNDLRTRGAVPSGILMRMTLPLSTEESLVSENIEKIQAFCQQEALNVLSARTEVSAEVTSIIAWVTAVGSCEEGDLLSLRQIRPGQEILQCGFAGTEGLLILAEANQEELSERYLSSLMNKINKRETELDGKKAIRTAIPYVSAIQQIESGGVFGTLWEVAEAAGVGLEIDLKAIPILQETIEISERYHLNPYQMTSAGAFLLFTDQADDLMKQLKAAKVQVSRIGKTTDKKTRIIKNDQDERFLDRPAPDEIARWQAEQREEKHGQ